MSGVDIAEELRAVYNEAKKKVEGKLNRGRRPSIFKQIPYIQTEWVEKYFCRFVHIASLLAAKGKPVGLLSVLLIITETRSLVLDVYEVKKEGGESSSKILENLSMFIVAIEKLEAVVTKMSSSLSTLAKQDNTQTTVQVNNNEEKDLPLLILAPHLMLDQKIFPSKDHPGGGDHTELFALCPDMAMGKKIMRTCIKKGYDELTCLLLTANAVGTLTMEILDKTSLRHRYYDRLSTCFSFCRMLAWAEVRRSYRMDLAKSNEWTEKVAEMPSLCLGWAFEATALAGKESDTTEAFEEAVIHRRRASSVSRDPASFVSSPDAPPPSPASSIMPPPPSPQPNSYALPPSPPVPPLGSTTIHTRPPPPAARGWQPHYEEA